MSREAARDDLLTCIEKKRRQIEKSTRPAWAVTLCYADFKAGPKSLKQLKTLVEQAQQYALSHQPAIKLFNRYVAAIKYLSIRKADSDLEDVERPRLLREHCDDIWTVLGCTKPIKASDTNVFMLVRDGIMHLLELLSSVYIQYALSTLYIHNNHVKYLDVNRQLKQTLLVLMPRLDAHLQNAFEVLRYICQVRVSVECSDISVSIHSHQAGKSWEELYQSLKTIVKHSSTGTKSTGLKSAAQKILNLVGSERWPPHQLIKVERADASHAEVVQTASQPVSPQKQLPVSVQLKSLCEAMADKKLSQYDSEKKDWVIGIYDLYNAASRQLQLLQQLDIKETFTPADNRELSRLLNDLLHCLDNYLPLLFKHLGGKQAQTLAHYEDAIHYILNTILKHKQTKSSTKTKRTGLRSSVEKVLASIADGHGCAPLLKATQPPKNMEEACAMSHHYNLTELFLALKFVADNNCANLPPHIFFEQGTRWLWIQVNIRSIRQQPSAIVIVNNLMVYEFKRYRALSKESWYQAPLKILYVNYGNGYAPADLWTQFCFAIYIHEHATTSTDLKSMIAIAIKDARDEALGSTTSRGYFKRRQQYHEWLLRNRDTVRVASKDSAEQPPTRTPRRTSDVTPVIKCGVVAERRTRAASTVAAPPPPASNTKQFKSPRKKAAPKPPKGAQNTAIMFHLNSKARHKDAKQLRTLRINSPRYLADLKAALAQRGSAEASHKAKGLTT